MEKWQENRNYRKIRDENGTVIANIITVDGRDVAVTEDVFAAYAQMDRRERYLSEDLPTGKVLSMEQMAEDGVLPDYVGAETAPSAEDCVLARESEREREELTSLLLAALIALEDRDRQLITALFYDRLSTREYARRIGVTQRAVIKRRDRILRDMKNILKNLRREGIHPAPFSGGQRKGEIPPPSLLLEKCIPAMRVTRSRTHPTARAKTRPQRPASDPACGRPWQAGQEMERLE